MAFLRSSTANLDWEKYDRELGDRFLKHDQQRSREKVRPDIGLKRFRKENRLSQIQMAKIMGVSRRSYIDYEHGEKAIPSTALAKLLSSFDCDLNVLFMQCPAPMTEQQGAMVANKSIDLVMKLLQHYPGLSTTDLKNIVSAMITGTTHPETLHEQYMHDYVEAHTDYFPSPKDRASWVD